LPDEINKWLLQLATTLFDFELLREDEEDIIVKLAVTKRHYSNVAKLTLFRYIDKNEKSNVNLEKVTRRAFDTREKYGDFHSFIMANIVDGPCCDGHSICESIHAVTGNKKKSTPTLISFEECKKRINSGESDSVFSCYTDYAINFDWENEEKFWELMSGKLKSC